MHTLSPSSPASNPSCLNTQADTSGSSGFKLHIDNDHNMWNYLYFIIFIWQQDKDDDDGLELFVRTQIANDDISVSTHTTKSSHPPMLSFATKVRTHSSRPPTHTHARHARTCTCTCTCTHPNTVVPSTQGASNSQHHERRADDFAQAPNAKYEHARLDSRAGQYVASSLGRHTATGGNRVR